MSFPPSTNSTAKDDSLSTKYNGSTGASSSSPSQRRNGRYHPQQQLQRQKQHHRGVFTEFLASLMASLVELCAAFTAAVLSHPAVQEAGAQIMVLGMNKFVTQPDLNETMQVMSDTMAKTQEDFARSAGEGFPKLAGKFFEGMLSPKKKHSQQHQQQQQQQQQQSNPNKQLQQQELEKEQQGNNNSKSANNNNEEQVSRSNSYHQLSEANSGDENNGDLGESESSQARPKRGSLSLFTGGGSSNHSKSKQDDKILGFIWPHHHQKKEQHQDDKETESSSNIMKKDSPRASLPSRQDSQLADGNNTPENHHQLVEPSSASPSTKHESTADSRSKSPVLLRPLVPKWAATLIKSPAATPPPPASPPSVEKVTTTTTTTSAPVVMESSTEGETDTTTSTTGDDLSLMLQPSLQPNPSGNSSFHSHDTTTATGPDASGLDHEKNEGDGLS
ncbi:hypothetical protein ACA910_004248 [Epithemia clementina (nom. ined.)]